jgi:hypothetical protein
MGIVGTAVAALAAAAVAAGQSEAWRSSRLAPCRPNANERAVLIVDGDLYAYVRSTDGRYIFGWSGPPVLDFPEAFRLVRQLGVKTSSQQLLNAKEVAGSTYADDGSIAYFSFSCSGRYEAKAVVRIAGPTRFWLQEQRGSSVRRGGAFCMDAQDLPKGALLVASFTRPLAAEPPTFAVDLNRDGRIDRRGRFRHGGARFPGGAGPDNRC